MTQPACLPDPETTVAMDPQPPHPNEDPTPAQGEGSSGPPTAVVPNTEDGLIAAPANTNPNSAHKYFEHPLQALLVTVVALLFGFVLTQTNDRITQTNDRITRLGGWCQTPEMGILRSQNPRSATCRLWQIAI